MDQPEASVEPAVAREVKQEPDKVPVVSSKNLDRRDSIAEPLSPVKSVMLRNRNDSLPTVENSAKELLTDIRPSSSRSDTPDQENRLRRVVKKEEPSSRATSVASSNSSRKPGRVKSRPQKRGRPTKRKAESSEDDSADDEKALVLKPKTKLAKKDRESDEYNRISDKWDDYRIECTKMSEKGLNTLSKHVRRIFAEVKLDYQTNVRVKAKASFAETVKNQRTSRLYKLARDEVPVAMALREVKEYQINTKGELPRMRYFIHIENNVMMPDRLRLSHIPYVEEGQDDFDWVTELRRHYTEGIHGADRGIDEYINDFLLERLLSRLETNKLTYTMTDVNFAIFTMFPNKYSFRELDHPEFLPRLKRRFGDPSRIPKPEDACATINYRVCPRDCQFACMTHISTLPETVLPQSRKLVEKKSFVPCGGDCGYSSLFDGIVPKDDGFSFLTNRNLYALIKNLVLNPATVICKTTEMANKFLTKHGFPQQPCSKFAQLAKKAVAELRETTKNTKKIPSEKDRHNIFRHSFKKTIDNSKAFNPCNHEGECHLAESQCGCYQNNSPCTAHCKCGPACRVLFPGCRCTPGQCRTEVCPCFRARWECDPATCSRCNPIPDAPVDKCCGNIAIQQNLKKTIKVGLSLVAGFGCFLLEDASKGDLISEYTGEVISDNETERRGSIQDRMKLSYVFNLNNQQSIDAGRMGNLIRFANHSNSPNCEAKTMMVDGVQRIGIYAKMNIPKGEEIFFDYSYNTDQKELYVNVKHPNAKGGKTGKGKKRD